MEDHTVQRTGENSCCCNEPEEHQEAVFKTSNAYRILVGKPEGKKHLKNLCMADTIILKWVLKIEWDGVDWIQLAGDTNQGLCTQS